MEPIDYVQALIRRWPIIAVCAFIGAAFAFVGTDAKPAPIETKYRATHTLLVTNTQFGSQTLVGTITFAQVPVFATRGEVPRIVAEQLGYGGSPAALANQVTVLGDDATGTMSFSTEQADPDRAVQIADAFADETVRYLATRQEEIRQERQAQAQADVDRLQADVEQLDAQVTEQVAERNAERETGDPVAEADAILVAQRDAAVREYSVEYESFRELIADDTPDLSLTTLERAQPVQLQTGGFSAPRTRATRVPIAAGIGALFGAALALIVERLDAKLRDRRRAEEAFGASVVGEIPTLSRKQRAARLFVGPEHHTVAAEAMRSLRTSVTFMAAGGQPSADDDRVGLVLITSPSPAEGKTTIAVNLASAYAETGRSVVLVNADFRRPVASQILVPGERPALPAGLAGINRLDAAEYLVDTQVPGVRLLDLSSLGGTPGDLIRATVRLVANISALVDVVIVDTPPLAVTTEALEFVPQASVVVLVGRVGRTPIAAARRAGELARFGGAEQLAITLTDTGTSSRRKSYYYDYYGGRSGKRRGRRDQPDPKSSGESVDGQVDEWREIDEIVTAERRVSSGVNDPPAAGESRGELLRDS